MEINKIYEESKKELATLQERSAVLKESIRTKAEELGLSIASELPLELEKLEKQLEADIETNTNKIKECVNQLESIKIATDEY